VSGHEKGEGGGDEGARSKEDLATHLLLPLQGRGAKHAKSCEAARSNEANSCAAGRGITLRRSVELVGQRTIDNILKAAGVRSGKDLRGAEGAECGALGDGGGRRHDARAIGVVLIANKERDACTHPPPEISPFIIHRMFKKLD
jgi:hypothetical protein